jgi:hypothetical protein
MAPDEMPENANSDIKTPAANADVIRVIVHQAAGSDYCNRDDNILNAD